MREPPTCWVALRMPDAAPASFGATPDTAIRVSETNCMPMPRPKTSIGPRMEPRYVLWTSVSVSQPSPMAASSAPVTMKGFGTRRGSSWEAKPAPTAMMALTGRKASPARSGLKPSTFCTKSVRKKNIPNIAAARLSIIA
ncbi:hypothetical protein SMICM17S_07546 [Streptomyces microflavus]